MKIRQCKALLVGQFGICGLVAPALNGGVAMNNCKPHKHQHAMTIAKYRPLGVMTPFNELVNEFFGRDIGQMLGQDEVRRQVPAANIIERDNAFELRLSAPGFRKEELKLNVEADMLTIAGEHQVEDLKENERYTRREFIHGAFTRSFRLPETVNPEGITADHANGILTIRIPKAEAAKPKAREISIN